MRSNVLVPMLFVEKKARLGNTLKIILHKSEPNLSLDASVINKIQQGGDCGW